MSADKIFVLDMENALELTKPCELFGSRLKEKKSANWRLFWFTDKECHLCE